MQTIVVAELWSLITLCIIALGITTKEFAKDRRTKLYIVLLETNILALLVDMISYVGRSGAQADLFDYLINSLAFITGSLILIPFGYYFYEVFSRTCNLNKWYIHAQTIVIAVHSLILFVMGMTGNLFSVEPGNIGVGEYPTISLCIIACNLLYLPLLYVIKGSFKQDLRSTLVLSVFVSIPLLCELLSWLNNSEHSYTLVIIAMLILFVFVVLQNDIIEEVAAEQKVALALARIDPLTSLGNRHVGSDTIHQLIVTHQDFTIMLLDVDHFKTINDTYGHPAGDLALKAVAESMKASFGNAINIRMGGDEFMVILQGCQQPEELEQKLQPFFDSLKQVSLELEGVPPLDIEISVGTVCSNSSKSPTYGELYHTADQRLYESKKFAGNHFIAG